jgi:hypothetical protein
MVVDERLNPEVCGIVTDRVTADTSMVNEQYLAAVEELRTAIKQAWNGEIPNGSITQEMLDPNIKLGSNDIYIGTEEPTGEDRPKMWVDPNGGILTPEQIGAMSMELLWENASPTSAFAPQTISVSLDGYDSYMIIARFHTSTTSEVAQMARVGNNMLLFLNDGDSFCRRNVTYSASSLTFSECIRRTAWDGSNRVEDNPYLFPAAIYGIKGVSE